MNAVLVLLATLPALAAPRGVSNGSTTPVGGGGATVVEPTQSTLGQQPGMAGGEFGEDRHARANPQEIELQTGLLGLDDVTILQAERELMRRGYPVTAPDGDVDPDTRFAIREFQRRNGLEVSGDLDVATLGRLQIRIPRGAMEPQR